MAKKISQLTQATQVKSDDVTVIVQDGVTKKLPLNTLVTKQDIENKKVAGLAKLDEIEATYENDTYTPTITVKNKSSVKTGEGDEVDYSANVMDGPAKSAILRGQTLVNLAVNGLNKTYIQENSLTKLSYKMQPNKLYLLIIDVKENTLNKPFRFSGYTLGKNATKLPESEIGGDRAVFNAGETGRKCFKVGYTEIPEGAGELLILFCNGATNGTLTGFATYNIMFLEYQEGMENWDIPYFEGMQSVKMPVLTTIGKNLYDPTTKYYPNFTISNGVVVSNSKRFLSDYIEVKPNTTYSISIDNADEFVGRNIFTFDANKNVLTKVRDASWTSCKFTTDSNAKYIRIPYTLEPEIIVPEESIKGLKVQLEESLTITSYEPYKSNILTTSEEVELRGIGDVKDELNLITGELTQRIGGVVLDGVSEIVDGEQWSTNTDLDTSVLKFFYITNRKINGLPVKTDGSLINDKFISAKTSDRENLRRSNTECLIGGDKTQGMIQIFIKKDRLTEISVNGFRQWLSQNPITVNYEITTGIVKTVDLMPSGTHPSTIPYCWKNGHIQLSSSGLLPNLEYSVVTSRAGQINQNAAMIVKNDKRIFDLEILLAGGLVNTTYQALTLQNQVETGLSKVSLSSETEPDYLLYHMIMKLIEEKAYKLDDLTEKVSVFYLYEKLSDEQFETIYSALYPFVEDEIVEEPVVEELPEVVEDEVIM